MSWHFLERWLQKVNQHSTLIGKFWITFLIVFRIVVVSSVGDRVYSDEQSEFKCNTMQVGCSNVCFNKFSPISHIRFWSFQIIIVTAPSIVFIVYSAHEIKRKPPMTGTSLQNQMESPNKKNGDREAILNKEDTIKQKRSDIVGLTSASDGIEQQKTVLQELFGDDKSAYVQHYILYALSVIMRIGLEILFAYLQYDLFGFKVHELYQCSSDPCPNVVDCFVSRPMEKTIFIWFMFCIAIISLLLNVAELYYLFWQFCFRRMKLERKRRRLERRKISEAMKSMDVANLEINDNKALDVSATSLVCGKGSSKEDTGGSCPTSLAVEGNPLGILFNLNDAGFPLQKLETPTFKYKNCKEDFSSFTKHSRSHDFLASTLENVVPIEKPYVVRLRSEKSIEDFSGYV